MNESKMELQSKKRRPSSLTKFRKAKSPYGVRKNNDEELENNERKNEKRQKRIYRGTPQ